MRVRRHMPLDNEPGLAITRVRAYAVTYSARRSFKGHAPPSKISDADSQFLTSEASKATSEGTLEDGGVITKAINRGSSSRDHSTSMLVV